MKDQTVFVTGSSRGIGRAIALFFARQGCRVVVNCANPQHETMLQQVKKEAEEFKAPCLSLIGNVGSYEDCQRMFKEIEKNFGGVDILINNAGISYIGLFQDMTPGEWNQVLTTNLTSVYNCTSLALPHMLSQKSGHILNISSVWGIAGASCEAAYSAAKGGMNALTKALAKELAPSNIQVNAIACGAIDTEMNHFLSEEERQSLMDEIPAGRLGKPEEVAQLAWQLATGVPYLTGQIIALDGGWL